MAVNESLFPNIAATGYQVTSPADPSYHCLAWAVGQGHSWWWPDPDGFDYWPPGLPREETLPTFCQALVSLGFETCPNAELEPGHEKVVLFALQGVPTHAARQLPNGRWTSKLGPDEDIEHALEGLIGPCYGIPALILRRPVQP